MPSLFASPLDIANRALQHCGVTRIRTNTWPATEDSKQAAECNFTYDKVRQAELRRNVWRFATRRTAIRPIDNDTMLLNPPVWDASITYGTGSIVADANNMLWSSNSSSNTGNQPGQSRQWSSYFGPLTVSLFDPSGTTAYFAGELVYTTDNEGHFSVFVSTVNGNTDTPTVADDWMVGVSYRTGAVINYPPINYVYTPIVITPAMLQAIIDGGTLPTTLPSTPGILWNNGGVLDVSQP